MYTQADASQPASQPAPSPVVAQAHQALTRIPPPASALRPCRAAAFDQLFVSHFIESFGLPRNTSAGPTWLERLPSFGGAQSSALATASIRSASMLSYGTWARDEAVQADAYRWYASALAQLKHSVAQGGQPVALLEVAVCAAVMLIHFETWAGTSRNAWVHHVKGAASLLLAAGPEACRRGFVQSVFSHLRFQVFLVSMQENTLHAFAEPEWLEVPFREQGKNLFDELVDALFAVQRCLCLTQKSLNSSDSTDREAFEAIVPLISGAANRLSRWNEAYMGFLRPASWPDRVLDVEMRVLQSTDTGEPEAAMAVVPALPEAALVSLFHAGRLIISQLSTMTGADLLDTAEDDSAIILQASISNAKNGSAPHSKLRPFMMLPGLKIASLWSPAPAARSQACALLLSEQILASPVADIAATREGYFSQVARSAGIMQNSSCNYLNP